MNQSLNAIIADLHGFLDAGDSEPIWDYLGKLELQLKELAGQRPTREEVKALIGEGIHKGMRVNDAADAYMVIAKLDDKTWDSILDFTVYGLDVVKVVSLREES